MHVPTIAELAEMDDLGQGFCLACGSVQEGCEPDAENYACQECGKLKVFGAAELALRGIAR